MSDLAIGIDLGTTNSCVACYRNNRVEILENADEQSLTPSCVFFLDRPGIPPAVGYAAKKMSDIQPSNGIYEIKRFIGKRYNEIKDRLDYFSFNVEKDSDENPVVVIKRKSGTEEKTPEEVCTLILAKLKNDAQEVLGQKIRDAVITVPAYFNSIQREVTYAAAKKAGFNVLQLFNEPTAAALSYYFNTEIKKEGYSLVYDLGGGTFDVSILKGSSQQTIEIVGVDGDTNLGGRDFDALIIDYVCDKLLADYEFNPKDNRREIRRLQNICEQAKVELSSAEETKISLEEFVPDEPLVIIDISREYFEEKADDLFKRTIQIVARCLDKCEISKNQINEVILAGGSTRIPKIQEMLSEFFAGKTLNKTLRVDQCVAEGAALQAAMLSNNPTQEIRNLEMKDVVSLSIGAADLANEMIFIIKRNSPLPISNTKTTATVLDQQEAVTICLYEGERLDATKNFFLGSLTLENLVKTAPGESKILITVAIDKNGILNLKAEEQYRDNIKEVDITYNKKPDKEIYENVVSAEENKEEDEKFSEFANLKRDLVRYCQAVQFNLREKDLMEKHHDIFDWCVRVTLDAHDLKMEERAKLQDLVDTAKLKCDPVSKEYNFELTSI